MAGYKNPDRQYAGVKGHPSPRRAHRDYPLHRTDSVLRFVVSLAYNGFQDYAERMKRDVPSRVEDPSVLALLEKYKRRAEEQAERERAEEEAGRRSIVITVDSRNLFKKQ